MRVRYSALFFITQNHLNGKFVVMKFVAARNYALLSPNEVQFLYCNRFVKIADQTQVKSIHEVGIKIRQILDYIVNQAGVFEYVGFMIKDLYNFIDASHRDQIIENDLESFLTYLSVQVNKQEQFFLEVSY